MHKPSEPQTFSPTLCSKTYEPDRYASALLVRDPVQRAGLLALTAFAAELQRIPSVVSEPMMGEIRLQWWRDEITADRQGAVPENHNIAPGAGGHPVLGPLIQARDQFALPTPMLTAMTEARSFDLYPDPMPDEQTLTAYLMKTQGLLFDMQSRVLGLPAPPVALIAAAARAYGLTRLLLNLPHGLAKGRMPLPFDRLQRHDVKFEELAAGRWSTAVERLRDDVATDASAALVAARQHVADLPRACRPAYLPLAVVTPQLASLRRLGARWLQGGDGLTPFGRYWRVWRAHRQGRV